MASGKISIPGTTQGADGFEQIGSVTGYLNAFGVTVAQRIRTQFQPLFDPASEPLSSEILAINENIRRCAGYPLYDAQLAVAESVKCQLTHNKVGLIVAECGSGKTKIGATALAAVAALKGNQRMCGRLKTFNVVLSPSHVTKKWVRELEETLPNTMAMVVHNPTELDRLYALYEEGECSAYAIISKETARDGYMKMPAVRWNVRKQAFLCPDCMQPIEMEISDDGNHYMVNADQFFFQNEHSKNHKCPRCGTPLWSALSPGKQTPWIKIGGYGWVLRNKAEQHLEKTKNEAVRDKLEQIISVPDGYYPTLGACRRYPISTYLKHKYRGRVDGCIADELHQYAQNSGQGDAMGEVFNVSRKFIGMTATLINGYSSGIFHLLYRLVPYLMQKDGKEHDKPRDFDSEYGVVETTYEVKNADYNANRRTTKTKKQTRQLPGVSPLVYSRFLLEHAAFLSLSDMGKNLPDYEEIPIPLVMNQEVAAEYKRIEQIFTAFLRSDKKAAKKILSAYLNTLTVYPDQPYDQKEILHPFTGEAIVTPRDCSTIEELHEKDLKILEIAERKIAAGEKVLIYTSWVRIDTQQKLLKLLTARGYRTDILTDRISPTKREEWVDKKLKSGLQILITNPTLVETGLDLNAFTTLIYASIGYNLFTLRQSSRRSWRINQTAPRIEVYLLYYENTMQQRAIKLMASKLAVAGIIEGNFTEEGLSAMSDVQDMTSQLAKELMLGIKDNVEDIAAAYKKMAMINPQRVTPVPKVQPATLIAAVAQNHANDVRPHNPVQEAAFAAFLQKTKEEQTKPSRKVLVDENQLSLFDYVA